MSLESMDDLFGVTELVKQIDDEERANSMSEAKDQSHHVEMSVSR